MNPSFESDNINSESIYCRFGTEVLGKLLQTIQAQVGGVEKSEDIEYVHKMRVTSRRIRATMPLFRECFPKKRYKKWLNEIKKVTQFLGAARDLDVQIEFIKNYVSLLQPTEPKTGIDALLEWHIEQRTYAQSSIINGLQELEKSRVINELNSYCDQMAKESANNMFNMILVREKAFWQISVKLDEFLAMEGVVHLENEVLKHHEMRIRAKWLRYTMECFAPLYPEVFSEEIEIIKNFQDILGEMHDCDVWIERIPKFITEIENENTMLPEREQSKAEDNQDLSKFIDFIKEKRKNQFDKFVSYWDTEKNKNSFEELRKNASAGFLAISHRTKAELANPYVKIAVIANINANIKALEAVIQDAERRGITVFLNTGDMLGFGPFPNEVIQTLYSKNTLSVIGNYDLEVLEKKNMAKGTKIFALKYTRKNLAKSFETYLRTLPAKLELEIAHKKLVLIHQIPDSIVENLLNNNLEEEIQEFSKNEKPDIIIFGNSHGQFTKKVDEVLFINPGSVGRSGNRKPQAEYAAITANPFSVELLKVNYDVEAAADALRKIGAPESYSQSLLRGLLLDDVIAEDKVEENDLEVSCSLITESCRRIAKEYWSDIKHSEQVTKLSLELFNELQNFHKLGVRERCWLECAAILHDIGLSEGSNAHHKNTLKLILNDIQLPFASNDRKVIANVARYHRKEFPRKKHYNFISLSRELRRKVNILASILRLADGLDFSHRSIVQSVNAQMNLDNITITGEALLNPILEEQGFNKKKNLFERTFAKKIVLMWKYRPQADDKFGHSTNNFEMTTPNSTMAKSFPTDSSSENPV